MDKERDFVIIIKVNEKGSEYKASGLMTSGMIKLMIGEMEVIKSRLIDDYEKSVDNKEDD